MRSPARITIIAALASATALVAAPAFANGAGQSVDMPPWNWYIAAGEGSWSVNDTSYNDGITAGYDAWDDSFAAFYAPDYLDFTSTSQGLEPAIPSGIVPFSCVTTTLTIAGDDEIVSCNQTMTTPWGLSITSDVRVLAPGDLARMTFYVTNTTSAPVVLGYDYSWDYGTSSGHVRSSEPSTVQDTSGNHGFLGTPDVWSYNFGDGTLNAGVAWGLGGQPYLGTTPRHVDGYDFVSAQLLPAEGATIAAGETIALAFFHKVQEPEPFSVPVSEPAEGSLDDSSENLAAMPVPAPSPSYEAETPASFMAEFASFSGRLTRGIPADITVGNWQPAAADEAELAETGAGIDEQLLMGGIAAALLGAGVTLLAIRRRTLRPTRR